MNQPPSKMIRELTAATFTAMCNDEYAAQFFATIESSEAATPDDLAAVLQKYAYDNHSRQPQGNNYNFSFVLASKALAMVDWRAMASEHWHSYCLGRIRQMYAPYWIAK